MGEILIAPEGKVYTDGDVYGNEIHLGNDDIAFGWSEMTEKAAAEWCKPKAKPVNTFNSAVVSATPNNSEGNDFTVFAKVEENSKLIQAGILYSDYYCYSDELIVENEEVLKFQAKDITENGGYAVTVRGLTQYDECYFRPFAIVELEGEEVIAYGDILMNPLFYLNIVNTPMTLELTDEDYAIPDTFNLSEWMKANGYEEVEGITTYLLTE